MGKIFNVAGKVNIRVTAADQISATGKVNEVFEKGVSMGLFPIEEVDIDWDNMEITTIDGDTYVCHVPLIMKVEFPEEFKYLGAGVWVDEYGNDKFQFINPYKTPGVKSYTTSDFTIC